MLATKVPVLLRSLFSHGYAADVDGTLTPLLHGLAHPTAEAESLGWVVSRSLLAQRQALSSDDELVMSLLALLPEVQQAWLCVMAARCKEAGQIADGAPLVQLVTQLQGAAVWVESALSQSELAPSPYAAIERELLGVSAEQAAATPMLARILAVSFCLYEGRAKVLPTLPVIDASGVQAGQNWMSDRLLALPGTQSEPTYVLRGVVDTATDTPTMALVLSSPWLLLLSMVVYAQYNWAAEARGGLLLELSAGKNAYQPSEISVMVQGLDGDETRCGTLAELLFRALDYLGMQCFPHHPKLSELNALLASIVGQLVAQQVWRYQDGASGQNGQYLIHPQFADICYRLPGSKVFNRTGRHLWQAIRIVAEQWLSELRTTRSEGAI
jgi:hypothetical protein